jgi:transcriptional regulator GlxA family with amidase domain
MARRVVLVVFPDLQLLDLVGPLDVFAMADRFSDSELSENVTAGPATSQAAIGGGAGRSLRNLYLTHSRKGSGF